MIAVLILLALFYGCIALGFRWGKQVGAGATRAEYQQHADREGGYLFLGVRSDTPRGSS